MTFSAEVTEQLRQEYHTRFGIHKPMARDVAEETNAPAGFVPSASERQAVEKQFKDYHATWADPSKLLNDWKNQACDESGLPVAGVLNDDSVIDPRSGCLRLNKEEYEGFITKDSGRRDVFESGCQRDLGEGKGAYDLVPVRPLRRLAQLYERGAKKYDDHNWRKGMPFSRVIQSMIRHAEQFKECVEPEDVEDHLAAVAWNAFTLMEYVEAIGKGQLPAELDDRFRYKPPCTEL